MKHKIVTISTMATIYLIIFILSETLFENIYTLKWTADNALLFTALISIIPVFFNKKYFAFITLTGYIIGVVSGETFGKQIVNIIDSEYPSPDSLHYGWLIWGIVFAVSIVIGICVEIFIKRNRKINIYG